MTDDTLLPFDLPSVCRKKITVDFNGGNQSSNGGLLLLREKERTLGVCWRLANTMTDRRDANRIRHEMFEMVVARVSAIACGYEDANDLDRLRRWLRNRPSAALRMHRARPRRHGCVQLSLTSSAPP